jgi:hypothetical protein
MRCCGCTAAAVATKKEGVSKSSQQVLNGDGANLILPDGHFLATRPGRVFHTYLTKPLCCVASSARNAACSAA